MFYRRFSSFLLTTTLLAAAPVMAQDSENDAGAILVLDASGSMWGKIGDRHKIEIAREVVGKTVSEWDDKTELGLIAYGHNRKGDCDDIETLITPGVVSADEFNAKTKALNPKGMTPLSAAVLKAAEALKYRESKATVILVSDGKETCDLDPCEIGRTLEATGVDFTAHIIGFDVPEEDTAGLQCLADETGGMFIEAKNSDDLMEAMNETREVIIETEAPVLDEATLIVPAEVPAGSEFKVEWDGPKNRRDYLVIRTPDREQRFRSAWVGSDDVQSPTKIRAPETPGTYTVFYEVDNDTVLGSAEFTVTSVAATLDAPDSVPAGSQFKINWTGPMNRLDNIRIFSADGEDKYGVVYAYEESQNPAKIKAPEDAGNYELRFMTYGGNVLATHPFKTTEVSATLDAPESVPAGSEFKVNWTGPMNKLDRIRIFSTDGEKKFAVAYAYKEDQQPVKLKAPEDAGDYELRFMTQGGNLLAAQPFKVTAVTATLDAPDSVPAGSEFKIDWTGPMNNLDRIRIFSADGETQYKVVYAYKEDQQPAKLRAPEDAGEYELRFKTQGGKVLATRTFFVTPVSATINFPPRVPAGERFNVEWTGPGNNLDRVRIFSEDGDTKFGVAYAYKESQNPAKIMAPKKPGVYEVRFRTQGGKTLAKGKLIVE